MMMTFTFRILFICALPLFLLVPVFAVDSIVVINEVHYHPAAGTGASPEFVEIYNQNAVDVDISGWRLSAGVDFTFPQGTVISGGAYLVVSSDPSALIAAGAPSSVMGPFTGKLSNGGETIRLRNHNNRVMDELDYSDRAPWPGGADGSGASLAKTNPLTSSGDSRNWTHSLLVGGTPGMTNFSLPTATPKNPLPADIPLRINEVAGTTDLSFWVELHNTGNSTIDLEGFVLAFEDTGEFVFPTGQSIAAKGYLVVNATSLSLPTPPVDGENLYLYQPSRITLLDSLRLDSLAIARLSDDAESTARIGNPSNQTPGSANVVILPDHIVINEILYHRPPQYAEAGDPPTLQQTTLLDWNTSWLYNESGESLPTGWANSAHTLGGNWQSGNGPFGYETTTGRPPEPIVTQLTNPQLSNPQVITYYFETQFNVSASQLAGITTLKISHETDDGAIYYLNGHEIARFDMPDGNVTSSTLASNSISTEADAIRFITVSKDQLVAGSNRLSVEVHQMSATSSDVVMGVKLEGIVEAPSENPPVPFVENPEEWIELYNRSASPANLNNWELAGAVNFTFPADTWIPAGGYLVVARDLVAFNADYPNVAAVGDFSGKLSNSGEPLKLLDSLGNTADEVAYLDDAPWPGAADGGGSSMELRHPDIDNAVPASWAASDNTTSSSWQNYSFTMTAQNPVYKPGQYNFHELRMGLLDAGEILLDDLSVVEDPDGTNLELMADPTMESSTSWRMLGSHKDSRIETMGGSSVMRLNAAARYNYLNNQIESNLTSGGSLRPVQLGKDYRISFRAKWLSGSPQLRFEFYYNKLAKLVVLDQPTGVGTPGAQNSSFSTDLGPTLSRLIHSPAVPTSGVPVQVSVRATDPDNVATLTLKYSVNEGGFQSVVMTSGVDQTWTGTIPGQSQDTMVQFYVEAHDGSAEGHLSYAPPRGPDSRALFKVTTPNDGGTKQSIRINMLASEAGSLHQTNDILDNHRYGCTLIMDEQNIAYDSRIRLRGSMWSRSRNDRMGFNLKLPSDKRYRGLNSTITVRHGNRREILVKHMINAAGGIHDNYNDIVQLNAHISSQNGPTRLEMTRFNNHYLNSLPGGNGGDGTVFKMEGIRELQETQDGTENSPKKPFPVGFVSSFDLADQGDDQEMYRNNFPINSSLDRDDYTHLVRTCKLFSLSGQALEDAAPSVINVDQWARQFAMFSLCGITDAYSQGSPHNLNLYARPDGIMETMPWDWDHNFSLSTSASLWGNRNVSKLFGLPVVTRLYHGHLLDLINTTYNSSYMASWVTHYGSYSEENYSSTLDYISNRKSYVLSQLPSSIDFAITSNGGDDFTVSDPVVTLRGDGWINVHTIHVNSSPEPLPVSWIDADTWEMDIPVSSGQNSLTLTAFDLQGNQVGNDSISILNNGSVIPASEDNLVISEMNYHPANDAAEEFIELQNIHPTATIDLTGVTFTNGIEFDFLSNTTLAPGARLVIVENAVDFAARYGTESVVAGVFGSDTGLKNSGERIRLESPGGVVIQDFVYEDSFPWPESPDGAGASMVLISPDTNPDHALPQSWRPSIATGGNPGSGDASVFSGGDLASYAAPNGSPLAEQDPDGHIVFSYTRNIAADDVTFTIQTSTNLVHWTDSPSNFTLESITDHRDGTTTYRHLTTEPIGTDHNLFIRVRMNTN